MRPTTYLILDEEHRCLLFKSDNRFHLPSIAQRRQERLLLDIHQEFGARFDVALPSPCGQFQANHEMTFTFIVPKEIKSKMVAVEPLSTWERLANVSNFLGEDELASFWHHYEATVLGGYHPRTRQFDVFSFGNTTEMASRLAHMVTSGKKRGTAFWVSETEHDKNQYFPVVGGLSLVTDGFGYPRCFIETLSTRIVNFKNVEAEFARIEGEGDLSFEDWRNGHFEYFDREAKRIGIPFTDESKIFLEEFAVVRKF